MKARRAELEVARMIIDYRLDNNSVIDAKNRSRPRSS